MKHRGIAGVLLASVVAGLACRSGDRGATTPAEAGTTTPVSTAIAQSAPTEHGAWKLPEPELGYNAREGRAIFGYYCAVCHGEDGHGDGFNAYNLDPKPRDLADPDFQAQRSDADLLSVVSSGGGGAGLSTGMPPWGRTLNERELRNVIVYLHTLTEPDSQSEDSDGE